MTDPTPTRGPVHIAPDLDPPTPVPDSSPALGLAELVDLIPYLLGYQPRDSLVLIGLRDRSRVDMSLRLDLAPLREHPEATATLLERLASGAVTGVVAAVYGDDTDVADGLPHLAVVNALSTGAERYGLQLLDAMYVSGDRWWPYLCEDPGCCPADGYPVRRSGRSSAVAAAEAAGLAVAPSREALTSALAPPKDSRRMNAFLDRAEAGVVGAIVGAGGVEGWRQSVLLRIDRARATRPTHDRRRRLRSRLSRREAAELLVALTDVRVRDECWLRIDEAPDETWEVLCRELVTVAPRDYAVEPLLLLGWTAWRRGDGVSARIAVERLLTEDPSHVAGTMLRHILDEGVDPRILPPIRSVGDARADAEAACDDPDCPLHGAGARCGDPECLATGCDDPDCHDIYCDDPTCRDPYCTVGE